MIGAKLNRRGFDHKTAKLQTLKAGETVQIGPFKVHAFHVCHSLP
jgi:ribonuclease J